mmetsp:Transcript_17120/g.24745  ORF Transcript_17120/g.24745 Transcript_17120/m.24745 type:complete len:84 (-) Transcript_17120:240-491(-)
MLTTMNARKPVLNGTDAVMLEIQISTGNIGEANVHSKGNFVLLGEVEIIQSVHRTPVTCRKMQGMACTPFDVQEQLCQEQNAS